MISWATTDIITYANAEISSHCVVIYNLSHQYFKCLKQYFLFYSEFCDFNVFNSTLIRIVCVGRTELKLETLEDAVLLDDEDNDTLTDKRGCPAYVSPEILRSHARYSGRAADMWSLGVILYTMLVGRCVHSISNSLTVTSHWSGISMLPVPDAHCCDKFAFHCTFAQRLTKM